MEQIRVCMITPQVFPVPSVKGGACEQLVTDFINMNEKYKKLDITVISVFDEIAYEESKKYKYTKFEYIKMKENNDFPKDLSFQEETLEFKEYRTKIRQQVDLDAFDFIVIEGGDLENYGELLKYYDKKKCIVHLHRKCSWK